MALTSIFLTYFSQYNPPLIKKFLRVQRCFLDQDHLLPIILESFCNWVSFFVVYHPLLVYQIYLRQFMSYKGCFFLIQLVHDINIFRSNVFYFVLAVTLCTWWFFLVSPQRCLQLLKCLCLDCATEKYSVTQSIMSFWI